MILRRVGYFVIVTALALPVWSADRTATISGYVRNTQGIPQMGAAVDVIGNSLRTFRLFTDENGFFSAAGVTPGSYSVRVSAPAFLPALREKVTVKAGAGVLLNLTLTTLFDAVQFAPRNGAPDNGDWDWVLRSTANRSILRILPDGSAVTVAKTNGNSDLKGTLSFLAGSSSQGFGSVSDLSTGFNVEKSLFASDTLSFGGDLGYGPGLPNAVVRTSYQHQMSNGSSPEIAFTMRRLSTPDLGLRNADLQALALSTSDAITVGDVLELKFGSELQTIQFMGRVTAFRPFGSVTAHISPNTLIAYRYSTSRPDRRAEKGFDSAPADLSETDPRMSLAGYTPALERAHHQEVAVSHREGKTSLQAAAYFDRVANPALTGVGEFSSANSDVLPDPYSGTFTYQGPNLDTKGMRLVLERQLLSDLSATVDYSLGGALEVDRSDATLQNARAATELRYSHAVSAKLKGCIPGAKTRWIASYGWSNRHTVTPVDMFNDSPGQADPFLDFFVKQPVPRMGSLPGHMDVVVEVRNLLAQGYVPVLSPDGRTVYLVQSARAVRGGVAFSF